MPRAQHSTQLTHVLFSFLFGLYSGTHGNTACIRHINIRKRVSCVDLLQEDFLLPSTLTCCSGICCDFGGFLSSRFYLCDGIQVLLKASVYRDSSCLIVGIFAVYYRIIFGLFFNQQIRRRIVALTFVLCGQWGFHCFELYFGINSCAYPIHTICRIR